MDLALELETTLRNRPTHVGGRAVANCLRSKDSFTERTQRVSEILANGEIVVERYVEGVSRLIGVIKNLNADEKTAFDWLALIAFAGLEEAEIGAHLDFAWADYEEIKKLLRRKEPQAVKAFDPLVRQYMEQGRRMAEAVRDARWALMAMQAELHRAEKGPIVRSRQELRDHFSKH